MSDVRINLLKEVKSAVNTASFAPTAERIEDAKKAVLSLMSYVESLEAPKPKFTSGVELRERKERRRKTKQKAAKATPETRVADHMDRAFHGRPDTPVTPSKRKPKADVEAARKSAESVSRHTGAESRAKRKAETLLEAVASPDVTSHDDRIVDLEAKVAALLALQAMGHDVMPNENEVLFSDLPFDPTTTM